MNETAWHPGDRVRWSNDFGQHFEGTVVRIWGRILLVKRPEWFADEPFDLDDPRCPIERVAA